MYLLRNINLYLGEIMRGFIKNNFCKDEAQWKKQKFTHFMVIDFEATCWDQKPGPPSEIIEFPAVILDASSRLLYRTLQNSEKLFKISTGFSKFSLITY